MKKKYVGKKHEQMFVGLWKSSVYKQDPQDIIISSKQNH